MIKFLTMFVMLSLIYGCEGGSDNDDTGTNSILGDWSSELERNGSIGELHWVISENAIDIYEVGNGRVMDEWHTGLDVNKLYKFTIDGNNGTYELNGNILELTATPNQSDTARIVELPSENEIYSWEIGHHGAGEVSQINYKLVNGLLTITLPDKTEYNFTLTNK